MERDEQHPIERALGIEAGSTLAALAAENAEAPAIELPTIINPKTGVTSTKKLEVTETEVEIEERFEDLKIEQSLDDIQKRAVEAFETQYRTSREVDPKFSARNAEVAAQYLNIALNTVNTRVDSKYKRGKLRIAKGNIGKPNSINNNVIVADRNDLLDALFPQAKDVTNDSLSLQDNLSKDK